MSLWYRLLRQALLLFLGASAGLLAAEDARPPTLEDALQVQRIGRFVLDPDGRRLAFESGGKIHIMSLPSAEAIAQIPGSNPRWSPDGRKIAFLSLTRERQLQVYRVDVAATSQVTNLKGGISPNPSFVRGEPAHFEWSPDSRSIAFLSREFPENIVNEGGRKVRVLTPRSSYLDVFEGVFRTDLWETNRAGNPDYAPDKQRVIAADPALGLNHLFVVDTQTQQLRRMRTHGQYFAPAWSADGTTIAAVVDDPGAVEWPGPSRTGIVLLDTRTGDEHRLPVPQMLNGRPRWSRDGARLANIGWNGLLHFPRLQICEIAARVCRLVDAPRNLAVEDFRWSTSDRLILRLSEGFVDSLWSIDIEGSKAHRESETSANITGFDQASGTTAYKAEGSGFVDRLYVRISGDERLVHDPNPQFSGLTFLQQQRVTWRNRAGDLVDGILLPPPHVVPGKKYPMIVDVYPRPAKDRFNLVAYPRMMGQLEAQRGYFVFLPGIRSPHTPGSFSHDENYQEKARGAKGVPIMVDDFVSGLEHIVANWPVDDARICMYGHSNGGYAANFLMTETSRTRCAVVSSGSSSAQVMKFFLRPEGWLKNIVDPAAPSAVAEMVALTPLYRMDKVAQPVMLLVGDQDWYPWLPEMLMQFNALRQAGKDVTLLRYKDEGHAFTKRENVFDSLRRVHEFFDRQVGRDAVPAR